jgi:LytS/YehU family sensor histidine kinase
MGCLAFYDAVQWVECDTLHTMRWWTILYACMMSTVITFINEGMANWQRWKDSLSENEKLRNAYQRSKLLGLKGQINPHFLFNCFNHFIRFDPGG